MDALLLDYQSRLAALNATAGHLRSGHAAALATVIASLAAILLLAFLSLSKRTIPLPSALGPLPFAFYSGRIYKRRNFALLQTFRLQAFYKSGIDRLEGKWAGSGASGEEFVRPGHPYDRDLQIFGEGSLFELLCTCRTEVGRRHLADYLLDQPSLHESKLRQGAIEELRNHPGLREQVHLLGDFSFQQSTWKTIMDWLAAPALLSIRTFVR